MSPSHIAGFDTETHLIAEGDINPRLVCATFDVGPWGQLGPDGTIAGAFDAWCVPNADTQLCPTLVEMFRQALSRETHLVIQNAAFDLCVLLRYAHDVQQGAQLGQASDGEALQALVWDVLEQGLADEQDGGLPIIHDTILREKLYNLSTAGTIDTLHGREFSYGLHELVRRYFDVDISAFKVNATADGRVLDADGVDITGTAKAGAVWRLRYHELDGVPLERWPEPARQYAMDDATWARRIFVRQEEKRKPRYYGSMNSEGLQVYAETALRLYASTGMVVDRQQVGRVQDRIADVLKRVEQTLRLNGVVRPNGSVNTKVVQARVEDAWAKLGRMPIRTETGGICCDSEVQETISGVDPILDMWSERQSLMKIQSSFLPALSGERIWTNYDGLKETGRTSSYGSGDRSKRQPLYPAINIQQIPRAAGIRECFLPPPVEWWQITSPWLSAPPPTVLLSADYTSLELCSVGQVTYSLFGYSVHRDRLLQGYELHSFLGAAMARTLAPHVVDNQTDLDGAYKALVKYRKLKIPDEDKSSEAERLRQLKKEAIGWRTFAKPTGLGYPGGLGPATYCQFAKATYGVTVDLQQAEVFRELWLHIYEEMNDFFRWVNSQSDMQDPTGDGYVYETQGLNRFRAGATYCATANGKSMQSLSADGAKRSVCWLARACFGGLSKDTPYALLTGCPPAAFIHDENLMVLPDDELLTERSLLVSRLMVEAMKISMPDVPIAAEPALMRRWTKGAEPEWVDDPGREARVEAAIRSWYGGDPPQAWVEEFFELMGPSYNPNRRLIPWDDKHALEL